jgi:hypothetical protein
MTAPKRTEFTTQLESNGVLGLFDGAGGRGLIGVFSMSAEM